MKDFVPVALICTAPNVMVVSPDTEVSNVAEFVAYAKANTGKVNYASGGIGSSSHLSDDTHSLQGCVARGHRRARRRSQHHDLAGALPGFETVAWFGVLAPAGTPKVVVERVNVAINRALELADVKARLATLGCDPAGTTPEAFAGRVYGDVARWKKLAAEKQIRAD